MKSRAWLAAAVMSISSLAQAQGISQTTDPARIAAIEQHAQQLASGAQTTPMMGDHRTQKHAMRRHKHKAMHKGAMKHKASPDKPMASKG